MAAKRGPGRPRKRGPGRPRKKAPGRPRKKKARGRPRKTSTKTGARPTVRVRTGRGRTPEFWKHVTTKDIAAILLLYRNDTRCAVAKKDSLITDFADRHRTLVQVKKRKGEYCWTLTEKGKKAARLLRSADNLFK